MKRTTLLSLVFLLAACTTPTQTSEVSATSEVSPATVTPKPDATATFMPTATPTKLAPEVVDLAAPYSAGPSGEMVGTVGDLCPFGTPDQCFQFASPEAAVKVRDGLQRAMLVMSWADSEETRAKYKTFEKYLAAVRENPIRSNVLLMQPDEQAYKASYLVDGYIPVDPATGEPLKVDWSRAALRVIDGPTARAEEAAAAARGEQVVYANVGGWYQVRESRVQAPDGQWVPQLTVVDILIGPDISGYGGSPLNPEQGAAENARAVNTALHFLFTYMHRFENMASYVTFDGTDPLDLAFFPVGKGEMPAAARGEPYIIPR